jgi:hypothetical protein
LDAVPTIAMLCNELDCLLVHDRVSSNLDKWPSAEPLCQESQGIAGRQLFPNRMDPRVPAFPKYRDDFPTGQQPNLIAAGIFNRQ